jgi:C4-dicarboxylate-specific signal transduction histidine kinase
LARGRIDQQRVAVRFDAPPGGCTLHADREYLRQVVLNLLLNALDVMPHGGTLGVAVGSGTEGRSVELSVTDTGPGINPAILPRLFEPFATNKETGIGLGLVVSKRIVEDHGGSIHGATRPEGGACFTVRLPRSGSNNGSNSELIAAGS